MNLKQELIKNNILLDDLFFERLEIYKEQLFKWNKIHNLTGIKNEKELNEFVFDALFPITFLPKLENAMDIGSGAGFPGMILAFAINDTHFTLVEPLKKRASFLQFIKATLELKNVTVEPCRVEELEEKKYDLITSRAVTDTNMLLSLSKPFCKRGTLLLFYKGERVYEEVDESLNYKIVETDKRHYLVIDTCE
jgi:16S rRNA (guanine527-N7)-methyltransferase